MAEESLKNKTVKGVGWSFADNLANQGITFIVGLVLARLLTPAEYGLIGIILIFIAVFNSIVDSGFSNALIRKKEVTKDDYSTAFTVNLVVSLVVMAIMYFSAGAIGHFFKQPELVPLTEVMSVVVLINALAIVQRTILVKNIDFRTQMVISMTASVSSGVVGIAMAFAGYGVWALVGQQISRQVINTAMLWLKAHWHPSLHFSKKSFHELFGFGWKLLVSGLIDTVWKEIYQVVIGKCYSPATLGQYTRAVQFSNIFSINLTTVVQRVSFPVLSSIQDDKERMKQAYRRVIKATMLPTFALMLGMAVMAKPLIIVLIGEKWLPAVPLLQLLCLCKLLYPLHAINLNMLQVQGRSDLFLKLEILKKIIAVIPVLVGIFISIYWMLGASIVTGIISYYLNAFYSGRLLKYSMWSQVKDILPSFGVTVVAALLTWSLTLIPMSDFIILPLQIVVGTGLTILFCHMLRLPEYVELKEIAIRFVKHRRLI